MEFIKGIKDIGMLTGVELQDNASCFIARDEALVFD